jgi:hypothetical protein
MPSLTKDASILELLTRLEGTLGPGGFQVADRWDVDLFAVGIACPTDSRAVVYISTWNHAPGRFYYECESTNPAAGPDDLPFEVIAEGDDVTFDELVAAIRSHFRREARRP